MTAPTPTAAVEPGPPSLDIACAVREAVSRLARRERTERKPGALTIIGLSVLTSLNNAAAPLTPGEIAREQQVQPGSLTRTLTSLLRDGLISRAPHPLDARYSYLTITPQGAKRVAHELNSRDAWLANAIDLLTEAEKQHLLQAAALLHRIATITNHRATRASA